MHPEEQDEQDGGEDGGNYASRGSKDGGGCGQPWWCAEAKGPAGDDMDTSLRVEEFI